MKLFFRSNAVKSEAEMPTLTLSDLCSEAADHVAKARLSLSDDDNDADRAMLHLDDAILCLRRLLAHGKPAAGKARARA